MNLCTSFREVPSSAEMSPACLKFEPSFWNVLFFLIEFDILRAFMTLIVLRSGFENCATKHETK